MDFDTLNDFIVNRGFCIINLRNFDFKTTKGEISAFYSKSNIHISKIEIYNIKNDSIQANIHIDNKETLQKVIEKGRGYCGGNKYKFLWRISKDNYADAWNKQ